MLYRQEGSRRLREESTAPVFVLCESSLHDGRERSGPYQHWVHLSTGISRLQALVAGHPTVPVAIIDGRVDTAHALLRRAEILQEPDNSSIDFHATHLASILVGEYGLGIIPSSRLISIPVFHPDKAGVLSASNDDIARAVIEAVDQGARVINLSLGKVYASPEESIVLHRALAYAFEKDVVVVASVGNDGCDCPSSPAANSFCIAVGACDESGEPLANSNRGEHYWKNGILAPGKDIPGAGSQSGLETMSGTSVAAAITTGAIALIRTLCPNKSRSSVVASVLKGAVLPPEQANANETTFNGILNAWNSYKLLSMEESEYQQMENSVKEIGPTTDVGFQEHFRQQHDQPKQPCCDGCASGGSCASEGKQEMITSRVRLPIFAIGSLAPKFRKRDTQLSYWRRNTPPAVDVDENARSIGRVLLLPRNIPGALYSPPYLSWASQLDWFLYVKRAPALLIKPGVDFNERKFEALARLAAGKPAPTNAEESQNYITSLWSFDLSQLAAKEKKQALSLAASFLEFDSPRYISVMGYGSPITGTPLWVVDPNLEGFFEWSIADLVIDVIGDFIAGEVLVKNQGGPDPVQIPDKSNIIRVRDNFNKIFKQYASAGVDDRARAINVAITQGVRQIGNLAINQGAVWRFQSLSASQAYGETAADNLWEVKLVFVNEEDTTKLPKTLGFVVDLSLDLPSVIDFDPDL